MSAAAVVSVVPVTAEEPEDAALAPVLGAGAAAAGQRAARLAALLDPGFLAEAGGIRRHGCWPRKPSTG